MTERYLTFGEVQQMLGLSADGVRELMESKALHAKIIDGVIQFRETEVMRLRGTRGEAVAPDDEDMGLVFLVDEEEEEKIEGKAYDGEELLRQEEAIGPAPGEELMEPVGLSEEQLRNAEVLGTDEVVAFGREVSERTREEEFGAPQLAEGEEIIEPSEVDLPEPEFGPLAAAVPEARREEPVEPTPEPEEAEPEVTAVEPEGEALEVTAAAEPEEPLEPAAEAEAPLAPGEVETVEFALETEAAPAGAAAPEEELTFLEEETGPMVSPVSEEAEAVEAPAEPTVVEPLAPEPSELTFEEAEPEPVPEPVAEAVEEVAAVDETAGLEFEPAPEEPEGVPAVEGDLETFEVTVPEPRPVGVTEGLELAVDEELADLEPEPVEEELPEPVSVVEEAPEPAPADEERAAEEAEEPVAAPEPSEEAAEPVSMVEEPVVEERAPEPAPAAAVGGAPADVWEELQQELSAEVEATEREAASVAAESDRRESDSERPRQVEGGAIAEEAEPVTEEHREEEEAFEPEEELVPLEEETAPVEEAPTETFDLVEPEEPTPVEEIEVADLEEAAPPREKGEEELVVLEEEASAEEAAAEAAAAKTLEEEVAELFGEEPAAVSPDQAFAAPAAEEDFDLAVFQQEAVPAEEALPTTDESLFEEAGERAAAPDEQPVETVEPGVEAVSRIRALTEERAAPSTALMTAAILLAFAAVALTGMLLWHLFNTG